MDLPDDPRTVEAAERQAFVRHELRTPLAVMTPLLDMLLDGTAGTLDEKQLNYLRVLARNVTRLSAMIASMVESGWLETAALPATESTFDIGQLVEATVADVRAALDGCPRLEADVTADLPPVRGDRGRLRLALRNVVVNACTYTPPSGRVCVTARHATSGRVQIVVDDDGCGVEPDELASVFDFGFRGVAGRERDARGLGIGLFVTREVVERHGGRIRLESTPGQGTRASLELPVATA